MGGGKAFHTGRTARGETGIQECLEIKITLAVTMAVGIKNTVCVKVEKWGQESVPSWLKRAGEDRN